MEIHPEHRKFLGFEWTFKEGSTIYLQFCVLPFGFSMICIYKNSSALHKTLEGRGIKAIICNDNGIAAFCGFEIAKFVSELVRNDLLSVECVIDYAKSDFNPKSRGKWAQSHS